MHGGAAGQVRRKAAERVEAAEIERALTRYAEPREDATPSQVLVEELREAAGKVAWLRKRLRESDSPLTSVEHDKLGNAEDRLHRIASDLARLGIESTMLEVKLAEQAHEQGDSFAQVVRLVLMLTLDALGVPATPDVRSGFAELPSWAYRKAATLTAQRTADASLRRQLADVGEVEQSPQLVDALRTWRVEAEKPLRDRIGELEAENERLRERVRSDGLATRLALPAADGWEPDPVAVAEEVAAAVEPDVLEDGELIPPAGEPEAPRRSRRRRAPSVLDHFAEARRMPGYRR